MRRTAIAASLLAASLILLPQAPARAMGELPSGEFLCYQAWAVMQSDAKAVPNADFLRQVAQPTVDRFKFMAASLAMVEDELDLADTWQGPQPGEVTYVQDLRQGLFTLQAELDQLQRELDCWDQVMAEVARREKLKPAAPPPLGNLAKPRPPAPPLPPNPGKTDEEELIEALERFSAWLRDGSGLAEERLVGQQARLDDWEAQPRALEDLQRHVDVRISGGVVVPLDAPDLGPSQEIERGNGSFFEIGGEVPISFMERRLFASPGVSLGIHTSRLLDVRNKGSSGTLDVTGDEVGLSAMGTLKLGFRPQPDLEIWVGGGVGVERRRLQLQTAGAQVFDDSGMVLTWQAEVGAGYDVCGCGLFADLFLRYRRAGEIEVTPPVGAALTLGARQDLEVGFGMRYRF